MPLEPNQMLSHYRLVEKIGEGGMGVVWKAEDTKLDRAVAVKILPAVFAEDTQRLARFEREAKLLATLNHPNVAAIYGFDNADGVHFLVLELIDGLTLSQMTQSGPLSVEEALDTCRQVAEGLEAAHSAGVIHRDLKPGNVIVTADGKAKVLDFGLAKGIEGTSSGESGSDLSMSPTVTFGGTQAGLVIGTAPYMSPEQARGKTLDKRTDIWSFGCLLHECLTGERTFTGETVTDTLSAILQNDPDWNALPDKTPRRIREILERCLEKSPRNRLHDIADARIELDRAVSGREWTTSAIHKAATDLEIGRRSRLRMGSLVAAGVLMGALATALLMSLFEPAPPAPPLRKFDLAGKGSSPSFPLISPDGKKIVYRAGQSVWIRDLGQVEPRELAGAGDTFPLAWSPDGEWIALTSSREFSKIPSQGGSQTSIARLDEIVPQAAGASWNADGSMLLSPGGVGLLRVPAQGGETIQVLDPLPDELDFHQMGALPDGRGVVFVTHRESGMDTLAIFTGSERKTVLQLPGQDLSFPAYSPTGHILFRRRPLSGGLWAVRFSLASLETTGPPFPVTAKGSFPSVAADGTLVYLVAPPTRETRLVWVSREGEVLGPIGESQFGQREPSLSPGGKRVAVSAEEEGNRDIWLIDTTSGSPMRFTFEDSEETSPAWSRDGEDLVFASRRGTIRDIFLHMKAADGSGEARRLARGTWADFSPDGRSLVFTTPKESLDWDLVYQNLEGEEEPVEFLRTDAFEGVPRLSPDGGWITYISDESGSAEIYLRRFPEGDGKWQLSTEGGAFPIWSAAGDRIYFLQGRDLMEVEIALRPSLSVGRPKTLFTWELARLGYAAAGDGQRFVMVEPVGTDAPRPVITVVENWFREFEEGK